MKPKERFVSELLSGFPGLPPRRARQRTVYWGTVLLASVLIGFSAWYIQRIPPALEADARSQLSHRPWLSPLVFMDGRDLVLRGEVESDAGIARDLALLASTPGVRSVSNHLQVAPRPTPEFRLQRDPERISLAGRLSGDDLERIVRAVRDAFPRIGIRDRITIDDRLGSPLWTLQLTTLLQGLEPLESFSLYAWRDRILIEGVAASGEIIDRVRYSAPIGIDRAVHVAFRLRPADGYGESALSLVSGWNGTALSGAVREASTARSMAAALDDWTHAGEPPVVRFDAADNPVSDSMDPEWLSRLPQLLPHLSRVHDLRLVSGGNQLWMWGRVDHPGTLGDIVMAMEATGLNEKINSRLVVDPADRPAEISLFRDNSVAVITGRLPSPRSRAALIETLERGMEVAAIEDFTTIEPGIAFSPWLENWSMLLPALPGTPFGLTIDGQRALVSGIMSDQPARAALGDALESMLPDIVLVDWLTLATDD